MTENFALMTDFRSMQRIFCPYSQIHRPKYRSALTPFFTVFSRPCNTSVPAVLSQSLLPSPTSTTITPCTPFCHVACYHLTILVFVASFCSSSTHSLHQCWGAAAYPSMQPILLSSWQQLLFQQTNLHLHVCVAGPAGVVSRPHSQFFSCSLCTFRSTRSILVLKGVILIFKNRQVWVERCLFDY